MVNTENATHTMDRKGLEFRRNEMCPRRARNLGDHQIEESGLFGTYSVSREICNSKTNN